MKTEMQGLLHEALHTTYVVTDMVDRHILEAEAIKVDPALKALAENASEALGELYQAIGAAAK